MSNADQRAGDATVGLLVDYVMGTRSETARHLLARQAFLRAFLDDERVHALFAGWLERTDVDVLASLLDTRVNIEKADHWSDDTYPLRNGVDLWSVPGLLDSLSSPEVGADGIGGGPFERTLNIVGEEAEEWLSDGEPAWPNFAAEAEQFVVDLNVPYPWLILALFREFLGRFVLFEKINEPGPLTMTRYGRARWRWPGWRRWGTVRPDPLRFEADPDIPEVGAPMRTSLEQKARWFYRRRVRGDSIRAIARSQFEDEDGDQRKTVREGIATVEHLFGLRPRSDAEHLTNGWIALALDLALAR